MANIPTNQHKYLVYKKQINMRSACGGTKQHNANVAWPGLGAEVERVGVGPLLLIQLLFAIQYCIGWRVLK